MESGRKSRVLTKFQLVILCHVSMDDKPDYLVTSISERLMEVWSGRVKQILASSVLIFLNSLLEELREEYLGLDTQP